MRNLDDHGGPRSGPVRDGAGDGGQADTDAEWAEYVAWADREAAAGRVPEPEPWALEDVEPWDPELDAPGLAGPGRPLFAEDGAGDVMAPSPFLAALTEQAVADVTALSDNELVGVLRASRRQVAREQYKQVLAAAEFGRRRQAAFEGALARGVPAGCAAGGFPGEELAIELTVSRAEAGHLVDDSIDLVGRLPRTLAGMAAGLIDAERAGWIAMYTRFLSPADTVRADEVLAAEAPQLQAEQLYRKASALEKKLNPEAALARKQHGRREQRVEVRSEASGNASLAGRELEVSDVLAAKAHLDTIAARLRERGLSGSLDQLRAIAMLDLTAGRNPLDRIPPEPGNPVESEDQPQGQARSGCPAPLPALVNLIVPAGTLLGFSAAPAQGGTWGLLDRDDTRAVVTAAAAHPATRWCVTLTGPDGTALAHGCARGPRPRLLSDLGPEPPPAQLAELLHRLNITFTPVARSPLDPAHAEDGYVPSRKLRHLVRARSATCDAPGCQSTAVNADLDHTVPWPGGPTDQGNLAPRCRTHHRAKQAPDWTVEQLAPGVTRWTLPSGRTHVTTPTRYDT
jgi:hypothetical protein